MARLLTSPKLRARMRRNPLMNGIFKRWYGGVQHRPHPLAPFELYFDGYRNLGWSIGGLASFEAGEMRFLAKLLTERPVDCAWDIGANVGLWTLFLAGLQPRLKKIVAFEPDPANLQLLRLNCQKNRLDHVQLRDVALSSAPGEARFFADSTTGSTGSLEEGADFIGKHYGAARQEVITRLSTIDLEIASGLPAPGFMKIDVEGHELSVLQGAEASLAAYHPLVLIEVTREADEVDRIFKRHGYRLLDPSTGAGIDRPAFSTVAIRRDVFDA